MTRTRFLLVASGGVALALALGGVMDAITNGQLDGDRHPHVAMVYYANAELITSHNRQSDEYLKVTANPGQGKGGVCSGDSGGPALLGNVVLGIMSYLPNSRCTGVTYSNRLDLDYALDFIADFE